MTAASGWKCFRAVLAARSPIHIGWHDLGFVQRTRYYIPARNLWGALVAGLAARKTPLEVPDIYTKAQTEFRDNLRVTYFFPLLDRDRWLLPKFHEQHGLLLGGMTEADFERHFLASQTSTALDASSLTAQEGALHESEYLAPRGREDEGPLRFQGYVLVREGFSTALVESVLADCRAGADRRYGWGRLTLCGHLEEESGPLFEEFTIQEQPDAPPQLRSSATTIHLPAHLRYDHTRSIEGDLEPLSGRDWATGKQRQGSGQDLVRAALCWVPGSRLHPNGEARFEIAAQGTWTLK